ncbi:MAG: DoxX family membrane protein [Planctomycetes bacterium]|nr:DoxX family membrane protein [Planctomycetota bacterium]MBL7007558.1 DoxX family membrane protein [Planctomycetota bacterium]
MNRLPSRAGSLLLLACLAGGGAMVWFGLQKVGDPVAFLKAIREYGLVPSAWPLAMNLLAVWIPAIEVLGGLLLILGVWRRAVASTLALMLVLFSGAVVLRAIGLHQDLGGAFCDVQFDCGCGTGEVYICTKLIENSIMLLCCAYAAASKIVRPLSLGR